MSEFVYLVPKLEVSYDDIAAGLLDVGASEIETDEGALMSWSLGDARIHLFEDPGLGVDHLVIEGSSREQAAERLRARIPVYVPADMPSLFTSAARDQDVVEVLNILGAVAPAQSTEPLMELFRRGFTHEDPIVRATAALAAAVPAWPELRADIERLAVDDEDDEVRAAASVVVRKYGSA